jgi:hypothetical protein
VFTFSAVVRCSFLASSTAIADPCCQSLAAAQAPISLVDFLRQFARAKPAGVTTPQ